MSEREFEIFLLEFQRLGLNEKIWVFKKFESEMVKLKN